MADLQFEKDGDASAPGLLSAGFSAFSLLLLLTVAVALGLRAVRSGTEGHARPVAPSRAAAGTPAQSPEHTIVYLVSSQAEGAQLNGALNEWRLEVEAMGTGARQPRRVVVVETPEEVLGQRVIDFAILAAQAPGLDLEVVDLRD